MPDSPPNDEPIKTSERERLKAVVEPLARAAVQKNRFNNRRWRVLFGMLMLAFGLLYLNNHNLTTQISHQHDTVVREATLTTADRALYCAQGAFLSQIIHASLANPSATTNPQAAAAVQGDLIHLDQTLSQVCSK